MELQNFLMDMAVSREGEAGSITRHLQDWRDGDPRALEKATAGVYAELRRIAGSVLRKDKASLQPTELVHELYLRLPNVSELDWQSRSDFLNLSALMMRRILVDHARRRRAAKRGGAAAVTLRWDLAGDEGVQIDTLAINEALQKLEQAYPRQARVVELRFFGGLTPAEICEILKLSGEVVSARTVERDWRFARAWLHDAVTS